MPFCLNVLLATAVKFVNEVAVELWALVTVTILACAVAIAAVIVLPV